MRLTRGQVALIALVLLVTTVLAACGSGTGDTATASPAVSQQRTAGSCGDGICDQAEQANAELCPSDCQAQRPATPTTPPPSAAAGRCGDGICDAMEQANPQLCPVDCEEGTGQQAQPGQSAVTQTATPTATPSRTPTPTPGGRAPGRGVPPGATEPQPSATVRRLTATATQPPCAAEEWRLYISGVVRWLGSEPSAEMYTSIDGCITVDSFCNIEGSGDGQYYSGCAYSSPNGVCSYEVTCPDFTASFTGVKSDDVMRIGIDASQIFEQVTAHCAGVTTTMQGVIVQTGYGSAIRNGGGYFCEMEASNGATEWVEGHDTVIPNLSYEFTAILQEGCP